MNIDHAEIAKRLLTDKDFTINISDMIGEFELSGVDRDSTLHKDEWSDRDEDCQILSFTLNDIVFTAVEDPNDGYRSSMRYVLIEKFEVHNQFQPIRVYTKYRTDNSHLAGTDDYWHSHEECDILEMYDKDNDKLIMRIGTGNTDDYYPYFVAEWKPENMAVNNE
jgi:hypothetical protein